MRPAAAAITALAALALASSPSSAAFAPSPASAGRRRGALGASPSDGSDDVAAAADYGPTSRGSTRRIPASAATQALLDRPGAGAAPRLGGEKVWIPPADFRPPMADASYELENGLTNSGPFAWMVPYLNLFGFRRGKALVGAVPRDPAAAGGGARDGGSGLRRAMERELRNLSLEEMGRRGEVAKYALVASGGYATLSALFLDDGSFQGHLWRLGLLPFLALYRGYQLSAETGL